MNQVSNFLFYSSSSKSSYSKRLKRESKQYFEAGSGSYRSNLFKKILICMSMLLNLYFLSSSSFFSSSFSSLPPSSVDQRSYRDSHSHLSYQNHISQLLALVHNQNSTISQLSSYIQEKVSSMNEKDGNIHTSHHDNEGRGGTLKIISRKDNVNPNNANPNPNHNHNPLQQQAETRDNSNIVIDFESSPYSTSYFAHDPINVECENRYGLPLALSWQKNRKRICESEEKNANGEALAYIDCYLHHHVHKKQNGKGPDPVCIAKNIFIDYSKVGGGDYARKVLSKNERDRLYHTFQDGSIFSSCKKTPEWQEVSKSFQNHFRLQIRSFQEQREFSFNSKNIQKEKTPVYLLSRDEDCENMFHSMADHVNIYLVVKHILNMDFENLKVILFDRHVNGPFFDMIQRAFSPNFPLTRAQDYKNQIIQYDTLIWHLESPASVIAPYISRPEVELRCRSSSLYHAYRRHILTTFNLWNIPPPEVPSIVLSLRKRTPEKNVGRILINEKEILQEIKQCTMCKVEVVDLATLSFEEQLQKMRHANILIGIHGAGLMHAYFLADEAIVMEIHPSYRQDRHFRIASRLNDKIYMPLRLTTPITCQGSSDNLKVDIPEFRVALDGAVRIARSFDDGTAECGTVCPLGILGLDKSLDPLYKRSQSDQQNFLNKPASKPLALNTRFPC